MSNHITYENCVGCLACENICPKNAISHNSNFDFICPSVDETICINCGLCLKVCPKDTKLQNNSTVQEAYAVKHMDLDTLNKSTSGGFFSSLADCILGENGVIYGCVLDHEKVLHFRTEHDYSNMRGSKYVQSDLEMIFADIAKDLLNGRIVLFTGTPCQCASVKNFIFLKKVSMENLILVDFICHGTTSPKLFADYIYYYEKKKKKKIENHLFRTKLNGWAKHTEVNCLSDKTMDWQSYESQLYKSIFHSHLGMNSACFECKFTSTNRISDITMADFWGIQKTHPELFDQNGVSFILINSAKGKNVFEKCENIDKHLVSIYDTEQPALYRPVEKPQKYEHFWKDYKRKGFHYIVKKYYHGGIFYRTISNVYHGMFKR